MRSRGAQLLPAGLRVPKEKDNETFAQGVTAGGSFGRHICLCLYSESARSGRRRNSSVPTEKSKLWRISCN